MQPVRAGGESARAESPEPDERAMLEMELEHWRSEVRIAQGQLDTAIAEWHEARRNARRVARLLRESFA